MVIVQLLVTGQQQGQAVAESILRNKFSVNVFGSLYDSYHLNKPQTQVYVIEFVTKSLLFHEIEASLRKEFPTIDFSICATPLAHIGFNLHDKIKKRVIGIPEHLKLEED